MSKINYSYDIETDSLFIYVCEDYVYEMSVEFDACIIMDFDVNGCPRAVELLSASKLFKIDKSYFNNLNMLKVNIFIDEDLIKLNVDLTVNNQEEIINEVVSGKCINNLNAPDFNSVLMIA